MRIFLINCVEEGMFEEFFAEKDNDIASAVNALYDMHFMMAFK